MKLYLLLFLSIFIPQQDCKENLDLLPMYGNVKKCSLQLQNDSRFIAEAEKEFETRIYAAHHYKNLGWASLEKNDLDSAMRQFNQSWLLDDSSYQVYWGFGNILGIKNRYNEAIKYFEIARKLNPDFAEFYLSSGSAYGKLYEITNNKIYLNQSIADFEKSASINDTSGEAYQQLAASYFYAGKKDLARKNMALADSKNPALIPPELRKELKRK